MSQFERSISLAATTDQAVVTIPGNVRSCIIANISGTFVGTIKIQESANNGTTWTDLAVANIETPGVAANPTAPGNYGAAMTATGKIARVVFSAYTSGSARVKALAIPYI